MSIHDERRLCDAAIKRAGDVIELRRAPADGSRLAIGDGRRFKETCSCGASIDVHGEGIWADKLMGILAEWRADHHHHEADGGGDSRLGFAASELAT